jgi:hypothetical protein
MNGLLNNLLKCSLGVRYMRGFYQDLWSDTDTSSVRVILYKSHALGRQFYVCWSVQIANMKISIVSGLGLPLILSGLVAGEKQYGVLGFGIPMYKPLCCYSCHDAMSALYLNCTTFAEDMGMSHGGMDMKLLKRMDMGGEATATTSDSCYASDRIWLETFSNCIHEKCSKDGVDESVQAQCFSKLAANGLPVSTFQDSLPSIAPSVELEAEATWLNATSLVSEHAYLANYVTMKEFVSSEHRHTRYA